MTHPDGDVNHSDRRTGDDVQDPMWALLAVADSSDAGHLTQALHHHDLASVPTYDVTRLLFHLANPDRPDFAVIITDSRLVSAQTAVVSIIDLVTSIRRYTSAPLITLGPRPYNATNGAQANLPPDTPADAVAATARGLASTARENLSRRWNRLRIDPATRELYWDIERVRLTEHQFLILDALLAARGRTVSHRQLARAAYGASHPGDEQRIRAHVARLRQRLHRISPDAAEIIGTGHRLGYRLIPPVARTVSSS